METHTKHGEEASANESAERAISRFRALGDGWGLSAVLYHRGWGLARFDHHEEAVGVYKEAIEVAARAGVHNTVQWATADLGLSLLALGRVDEASDCFARTATSPDQVGDDAGRVLAAYGEALVAQRNGDLATARPLFAAAYAGFEKLGVSLALGHALIGLAACDEASGELSNASAEYGRVVDLGEASGEVGLLASGLEGLARAAARSEDWERAAHLIGRSQWLRETFDRPRSETDVVSLEDASAAARKRLGAKAFANAMRTGAEAGLSSSN